METTMKKTLLLLALLSSGCIDSRQIDYALGDMVALKGHPEHPVMLAVEVITVHEKTHVITVRWENGQRICEEWCELELKKAPPETEKTN
jgi:hypothetical protein